jgi:asparagine synthase (glutamine-hydrolysing)
VVLTGDGGDELSCGYGRYDAQRFPGDTHADRMKAYLRYLSKWTDPTRVVAGAREPATPATQPERWLRTSEFCNQMMYLDSVVYLPDDLLVKVDRAAMAVGFETRVPCLDRRVFEFVWRLPLALNVNQGQRKWILRQILYRGVPPDLVDRPKQGFEVPLKTWLTAPLRDWAESLLEQNRLRREGFFDPDAVREGWSLLRAGPNRLKHALWVVLMFQAWLDQERVSEPAAMATSGD